MEEIKGLQAENRRLSAQYDSITTHTGQQVKLLREVLQSLSADTGRINASIEFQTSLNDALQTLVGILSRLAAQ